MMKVYIAEKPSLGRALASELAKRSPMTDRGRAFQAGRDWAVCWASGHIYENAEPDHYIAQKFPDAAKSTKTGRILWSLDHIPIQPGRKGWPDWKLVQDKDKKDLFRTIKQFVAKADVIVNAGDVDREGQRLIDEILEELGNRKPVRRVLVTSNDAVTVAKALADERANEDFRGMSLSALARMHADWYCGMNLSRLLTLTAATGGYRGVLPYGRVQTPVLGLIVQRDLAIEHFQPVDYFGITATISVESGTFKAKWKPHEGQAGLDEEGRLLDQAIAQQLAAAVQGKNGRIAQYEDKEKRKGPPMPFNIDTLRILGIRKYGLTADKVTEIVQALYDAKYVSYPRSDCAYLPTSQHADAPRVLSAVKGNIGLGGDLAARLDPSRKTRAWNDSKVTAHHGIVPTGEAVDPSTLPRLQGAIYREICLRYLAQFMPEQRYRAVSVLADIAGQHFTASGRTVLDPGWEALYGREAAAGNDGGDDEATGVLPPMKQGDATRCQGLDIQAKKTTPPRHFTEDTLLEAMTSVHKYVESPKIRAIFKRLYDAKKDGDEGACGLGTAATRQTYVPKLASSGLIEKAKGKGKESKTVFLVSTSAARAYIQSLPRDLAAPDMTALWEVALANIAEGKNTYEKFMDQLVAWVDAKIREIGERGMSLPASEPPARTGKSRRSGGKGKGKRTRKTSKQNTAGGSDKSCPECGKPMRLRQSTKGAFYGCTGYPQCRHTEDAAGAA